MGYVKHSNKYKQVAGVEEREKRADEIGSGYWRDIKFITSKIETKRIGVQFHKRTDTKLG